MSKALLITIPSDSHSWNLVFMKLFLEEAGVEVESLGPCTPIDLVVQRLVEDQFDFVVVSTINGNGYIEGIEIAASIKARSEFTGAMFIGGKLTTGSLREDWSLKMQDLLDAGYQSVYDDHYTGVLEQFTQDLEGMTYQGISVLKHLAPSIAVA